MIWEIAKVFLCVCVALLDWPGVDVGRLDGVEEELGHTHALHVDEVRLEQGLRGLEAFSSHLDHTAVWQLHTRGRDGVREKKERGKMTPSNT